MKRRQALAEMAGEANEAAENGVVNVEDGKQGEQVISSDLAYLLVPIFLLLLRACMHAKYVLLQREQGTKPTFTMDPLRKRNRSLDRSTSRCRHAPPHSFLVVLTRRH